MTIPIATEKVVRGILRSLVQGGYFTSDLGETILSALPANATDVDISNAANSFTYNSAVITGISTPDIISNTNLTLWIDADSTGGPHYNYFRVATQGTVIGDYGKDNGLFTIGRQNSIPQNPTPATYTRLITAVLGPDLNQLANTDTTGYPVELGIGSYYNAGLGQNHYFGHLLGSSTAVPNTGGWGTKGFVISTKENMELAATKYIAVRGAASATIRGGFYLLDSVDAGLFVGPYPSTVTDAITLAKISGTHNFELRMSRTVPYEILYINSAESSLHSACVAVNGRWSETERVPTYADYANGGVAPALCVFGTESALPVGDVVLLVQSPQVGGYTNDVVRIMAKEIGSAAFNLLTCYSEDGGGYNRRFRVTGNGACYCDLAFTGGGADLAEWMLTDAPHDPGSVLIMRNGIAVLSDEYEATGVIGVVSSQPGLVMNGICEEKENHVRVARSGMVPVFFSTEFGDVEGNGELLCAGPGGYAVRAPELPRPGSVIGKAMSAMRSTNGEPVCGVIKMIVG